jgi:hypothetical protein
MITTSMNLKSNICLFLISALFLSCQKNEKHYSSSNKVLSDSNSIGGARYSLNDSISMTAPHSPPVWYFYLDELELPIVERLQTPKIYLINNYPIPDPVNSSSVYIKRDMSLLTIDKRPATIYQGGAAIVEGKSISLLHASAANTSSIGHNLFTSNDSLEINGSWKIISDQKPSLIADLKTPRHFRISVNSIEPNPAKNKYRFSVFVDDVPLNLDLVNTSNVDTYGSKIGVVLKSWPPIGQPYQINGTFRSWK